MTVHVHQCGETATMTRCARLANLSFARPHGHCAVVGASSRLLAAEHGVHIDNATFVLRTNTAPTKGFELHVGENTNLRVVGSKVFKQWELNWHLQGSSDNDSVLPHRLKRANHQDRPESIFVPVRSRLQAFRVIRRPPQSVGFGAKDFLRDCVLSFVPPALRYAHRKRTRLDLVPTTGFVAVVLALVHCKRVALYGFGMGEDERRTGSGYSWYYRDNNQLMTGRREVFDAPFDAAGAPVKWHDLPLEWRLLERLQRKGCVEVWR